MQPGFRWGHPDRPRERLEGHLGKLAKGRWRQSCPVLLAGAGVGLIHRYGRVETHEMRHATHVNHAKETVSNFCKQHRPKTGGAAPIRPESHRDMEGYPVRVKALAGPRTRLGEFEPVEVHHLDPG